jgi:uncharacterized protein (DUF488 family)
MLSEIWTIGHSTRSFDEFFDLLGRNRIERLADIRRHPGSRRCPHFSGGALAESLQARGIAYLPMPELGGRRRPQPGSPNTGWRNEQFRAYADYMGMPEFREAAGRLLESDLRTAIMCAEAVPWRCHRNLVADELVRRGLTVRHIVAPELVNFHRLNPMAREVDGHLIYPGDAEQT